MSAGLIARALVVGAGTLCFATFAWGVRWHFRAPGGMPAGMRLINLASLAGFGWFVWRAVAAPLTPAWPAMPVLAAASLALFLAAARATRRERLTLAFSSDQPDFLVRHGPYRWIRHPFYTAYLLFWTATATIGPGLAPWAMPACMLVLYWLAARREEAKFAGSPLRAAYAGYRAGTGMFTPTLARYGNILPRNRGKFHM